MLKIIRVTVAVLALAVICLLFYGGKDLAAHLAILAKAQLMPAILAGSLAVVAGIAITTLIFGRLYCSVLCPLGLFQDAVSHFGKKNRFRFSKGKTALRLGVLIVFAGSILLGIPAIYGLLEPYSAFGRIAALCVPAWRAGTGAAMDMAGQGGFASPVWIKGLAAGLSALITLAVIGVLAWKGGRTWCNTLCPVGTALGFLSAFSLLKPRIDAEACVKCGLCARQCKSSCINADTLHIDTSRCVSCFNCLQSCRKKAIAYGLSDLRHKHRYDGQSEYGR